MGAGVDFGCRWRRRTKIRNILGGAAYPQSPDFFIRNPMFSFGQFY
jgi:hypothetical protein